MDFSVQKLHVTPEKWQMKSITLISIRIQSNKTVPQPLQMSPKQAKANRSVSAVTLLYNAWWRILLLSHNCRSLSYKWCSKYHPRGWTYLGHWTSWQWRFLIIRLKFLIFSHKSEGDETLNFERVIEMIEMKAENLKTSKSPPSDLWEVVY